MRLLPFIIPLLAGISTTIGFIPTYISRKYQKIVLAFSLAFSASVMMTISIFSLIPEAYKYLALNFSFPLIIILLIFINIGIIISFSIHKRIDKIIEDNKLFEVGILSLIVLVLHNIPEGITTFLTTSHNIKLGISLSLAIALHNIPEGIAIAIPIYYSTNNRWKAFLYTLISGFSEFLGAVLASIFLKGFLNNLLLSIILAITAGIMLQLSLFHLLPNSFDYKKKLISLIGIILGFIIMISCLYFFHI